MKFKVLTSDLVHAINALGKFSEISVIAADNQVILQTNEDALAQVVIPCAVDAPGAIEFIESAKMFVDYIKRCDAPTLMATEQDGKLVLKHDKVATRFFVKNYEGGPISFDETRVSMKLNASRLLAVFRAVSDFAARTSARPVLHGVHFGGADGETLDLVATDGYRMAIGKIAMQGDMEPFTLTLGQVEALMRALRAIVRGQETAVSWYESDGKIFLSALNFSMCCNPYDMQYINYQSFSTEREPGFTVNVDALRGAIKQVKPFAGQLARSQLHLNPEQSLLTVSGGSEIGDCTVDVAIVADEPSLRWQTALDLNFLTDALDAVSVFGAERIHVCKTLPVMFSAPEQDYWCFIMPMQARS